ncbi:hypothetical protein KAJ02_10160 [Candidatus Bipolaricaulota bacterium]|nr:hypothetical protein [Candidatus Bipolaricaulota bacterium]MCK5586422.1 hypothetical protein [Candidatus Bipolaricaulota bacterium]
MNLKAEFSIRAFVIYLACFGAAWILAGIVWAGTTGAAGGLSLARNPEYQQKIQSLLQDKGIDADASRAQVEYALDNLSEEDQRQFSAITESLLGELNWFLIAALASAILFGVIGFLGGLISRAWLLASVVPIPALLFSKSMIDFPRVQDLGVLEKAIVIVFAQIAVCCLFAYLGSRLRPRAKLAKQ